MERRQLWNYGKTTAGLAPSTTTYSVPHCTPFTLPSNGILSLATDVVMTLTANAEFAPECTSNPNDIILTDIGDNPSSVANFRDPFYASTLPQTYALAATTVIAYMLFIMLLITPRTFLHHGAVVLGKRGFTNGPSGSDAGIGIGGRPWLQKVAALTVAISLSIATADTFKVAQQQYNEGIMDAFELQQKVENGNELKIIRIISDTFLWLAQAQTLIRLFPRQKEKVIIKWTAFALVTLDALFSILNTFHFKGTSRPRTFVDAVPALAYLFQLTLSLLYCAWVLYYALMKRRFAFYHPLMQNICLIALLSILSVLVPIVFFVLDISKSDLAAWGDYVRWVGAAAASVVVWEWVERIECLERADRKDGILGREVFDGDEMLDPNPPFDPKNQGSTGNDGGATTASTGRHAPSWPRVTGIVRRYRHNNHHGDVEAATGESDSTRNNTTKRKLRPLPTLWPSRPEAVATPISRTDTASAESTVYAVRYHPVSEATPRPVIARSENDEISHAQPSSRHNVEDFEKKTIIETSSDGKDTEMPENKPNAWHALTNASFFRRKVQQPPPEVSAYRIKTMETVHNQHNLNRWDIRGRFEDFAITQAEKIREKTRPPPAVETLKKTVIPAPVRPRDHIAAAVAEIEAEENQRRVNALNSRNGPSLNASSAPHNETSSMSTTLPSHSIAERSGMRPLSHVQRQSVAFVTTLPQDQRPRELDPISPLGHEEQLGITPVTSRTTNPIRSPTNTDGLPLLSIPAPPRRPRTEKE